MPLNGPSTTLSGIRVVVVDCLDMCDTYLGLDLCLSLLASELVRASNLIANIGDKPVKHSASSLGFKRCEILFSYHH
jgi:hypothetical protein